MPKTLTHPLPKAALVKAINDHIDAVKSGNPTLSEFTLSRLQPLLNSLPDVLTINVLAPDPEPTPPAAPSDAEKGK